MNDKQVLIFISGQAGSGKSTKCRELTFGCKTIVLSTSFFHALAINGTTINNFLGVGLCLNDLSFYESNQITVFEKNTIIVVEEVSRLSMKMFHIFERVLRNTFNKSIPFGGVPIALVGDMTQFPIIDPFCDSPLFHHFRIISMGQKFRKSTVVECVKVIDHHGPRFPKPIKNLFWNNQEFISSEEPSSKQVYKDDNIIYRKTVYRIHDLEEKGRVKTSCGQVFNLDQCQLLSYFIKLTSERIENRTNIASKTWFLEKIQEIDPILDFLCINISHPFHCWKGQQVMCMFRVDDVKANELGCVIDIGKNFVSVHFDHKNKVRKIPLITRNVYKTGVFSDVELLNEIKVGKIKFMPLIGGYELHTNQSIGLMFETVLVEGNDQQFVSLCSRGRTTLVHQLVV
jgi:hypothetical protein